MSAFEESFWRVWKVLNALKPVKGAADDAIMISKHVESARSGRLHTSDEIIKEAQRITQAAARTVNERSRRDPTDWLNWAGCNALDPSTWEEADASLEREDARLSALSKSMDVIVSMMMVSRTIHVATSLKKIASQFSSLIAIDEYLRRQVETRAKGAKRVSEQIRKNIAEARSNLAQFEKTFGGVFDAASG